MQSTPIVLEIDHRPYRHLPVITWVIFVSDIQARGVEGIPFLYGSNVLPTQFNSYIFSKLCTLLETNYYGRQNTSMTSFIYRWLAIFDSCMDTLWLHDHVSLKKKYENAHK